MLEKIRMVTISEARNQMTTEFTKRTALTTLLIVGLLGLQQLPRLLRKSQVGHRVNQLISPMSKNEMSRENVDALVDGYYEGLRRDATAPGLPGEREDINFRDDFLRYELKPNLKRPYKAGLRFTNSMGMANPEYPYAKPPHTRRIALLGDSLSLGPYGKDYVARLEDRLNQNCRTPEIQNYEVLNFSVYAYSIVQMMDVGLNKAPLFHPDAYVFTITDLEGMDTLGWTTHVGSLLTNGTDLKYDYLRQVVADAGLQSTNHLPTIRKRLKPYILPVRRWALQQVRDKAAAQGASMAIFLIPAPLPPDFVNSDFNEFREAALPLGVPIIDLRDTFSSVNLSNIEVDPNSDIHPNALGHAMIADNLFAKLQAQPGAWLLLAGHPCEVASSATAAGK
jgi:hypothetical protein